MYYWKIIWKLSNVTEEMTQELEVGKQDSAAVVSTWDEPGVGPGEREGNRWTRDCEGKKRIDNISSLVIIEVKEKENKRLKILKSRQ